MLSRKLLNNFIRTQTLRALPTPQKFFFSNKIPGDVTVRPEVEEKIMSILKLSPKCEQSKLTPSAKFADLGFDSLDIVEMIVAFEENLGYDLPSEVAEGKIETVQDALIQFSKYFPEASPE
jgi:NADH dehydrogenase (ubiquinone) 1 alpha/beta subcomplex 1